MKKKHMDKKMYMKDKMKDEKMESNFDQIPNFIQWCEKNSYELPHYEVSKNENRARTGSKEPLYPPQYYAGQYPALWKIPRSADSHYYQEKGGKDKYGNLY